MAPRPAANHQATAEQGAKHLGRPSGAPSARAPRPPPAAPERPTGRRAEQSFNSVPDRVFLIQVAASKTKIYMVLELVNGGELLDRIQAASEGKLPEQEARRLFQHLVLSSTLLYSLTHHSQAAKQLPRC
ncbi:hypothetical protein ZEAMMB73_Zm00001d008856 [Zea mays]|uniref:Protein kinase domain-containing protein n=1 Tax=Zea mays TaxID=4577 RepID=C0PI21_MAIZE|nr:unknown [Zea mays]AQK90911.1 hypothetical protein ZEAMMB73_Zm00001d008856 [Zea mays]AQK90913.1 hypothetical protein ZEAMMB73_Zm00001d008856 [Zea mays]